MVVEADDFQELTTMSKVIYEEAPIYYEHTGIIQATIYPKVTLNDIVGGYKVDIKTKTYSTDANVFQTYDEAIAFIVKEYMSLLKTPQSPKTYPNRLTVEVSCAELNIPDVEVGRIVGYEDEAYIVIEKHDGTCVLEHLREIQR